MENYPYAWTLDPAMIPKSSRSYCELPDPGTIFRILKASGDVFYAGSTL